MKCFVFFSSRRRHTRLTCDWSSDVCSSDLVDVRLAREGGGVRLIVRDTGEGIDPSFLPHVFEPFRQGEATSRRRHGGLGLGLAIVQRLVELHGGAVTARSDGVGRGSEFVVFLPAAAPPDPTTTTAARGAM